MNSNALQLEPPRTRSLRSQLCILLIFLVCLLPAVSAQAAGLIIDSWRKHIKQVETKANTLRRCLQIITIPTAATAISLKALHQTNIKLKALDAELATTIRLLQLMRAAPKVGPVAARMATMLQKTRRPIASAHRKVRGLDLNLNPIRPPVYFADKHLGRIVQILVGTELGCRILYRDLGHIKGKLHLAPKGTQKTSVERRVLRLNRLGSRPIRMFNQAYAMTRDPCAKLNAPLKTLKRALHPARKAHKSIQQVRTYTSQVNIAAEALKRVLAQKTTVIRYSYFFERYKHWFNKLKRWKETYRKCVSWRALVCLRKATRTRWRSKWERVWEWRKRKKRREHEHTYTVGEILKGINSGYAAVNRKLLSKAKALVQPYLDKLKPPPPKLSGLTELTNNYAQALSAGHPVGRYIGPLASYQLQSMDKYLKSNKTEMKRCVAMANKLPAGRDMVQTWSGGRYVLVRRNPHKPPHFPKSRCPGSTKYRYDPRHGVTQCLTNNRGNYTCPSGFRATAKRGIWDCYRGGGRPVPSRRIVQTWNGRTYINIPINPRKPPLFSKSRCPGSTKYRYDPRYGVTQCLTNNRGNYTCPSGFRAALRSGLWNCYR